MDLTDTVIPKSDQLNADDLMTGPVTVTIQEVRKGSAEQPVNVLLEEFPGRPFRPNKSMRRVMIAGWKKESSAYVGRRMVLFRNPEITFGGDKVGGIQISHMSHLEGNRPLEVYLTVTRGSRKPYIVQPLIDGADPVEQIIFGFAGMGVTVEQLEAHVALPRAEWDGAIVNALRTVGGEISRGEKQVTDVFEVQS